MAKYEVVKDFTDLNDKNHVYVAGDKFPRSGKATKARIEELSGKDNKRKEVLIKEVKEGDK